MMEGHVSAEFASSEIAITVSSRKRREIASNYCSEVLAARFRSYDVVLIVGSVARGIATPTSDIDIAIIDSSTAKGARVDSEMYRGYEIGLEYYGLSDLRVLSPVPLVNQKQLREFGRLAGGIVLADQAAVWPEVTSRLQMALLDHATAGALLQRAYDSLATAAATATTRPGYARWCLLSTATSLAILALNFAPCRFQKPQWIIGDLRRAHATDLLRAFSALLRVNRPERWMEMWRATLDEVALPASEVPPFAQNHHRLVEENITDLFAFVDQGDMLEWTQMAVFVARMAFHLLRTVKTDVPAIEWPERTMRELFVIENDRQILTDMIAELHGACQRLERLIRGRYGAFLIAPA